MTKNDSSRRIVVTSTPRRAVRHAFAAAALCTIPALSALADETAASHLSVSGDFRVRGQEDTAPDDTPDRSSAQVRARLGATYTVNDMVTVGARLATGDPDDPNSSDVQLSNFDDDLQVALDLAYVQLNLGDVKLVAGKIPQPFTRTDLVWDSDVNPQGFSAAYKHQLGSSSAFRATGLFFVLDEQATAADSTMTGAQLGFDSTLSSSLKYDVSAAYYDYKLGSVAGGDAGDFRSNLRNPDGSYLSDFNLVDVVLGMTWSGAGERWPVRVVGDFVRNLGAETSDDEGYGLDVTVGRASKQGDWRVTYGYSVAQTDAVLAAFSHDNIGLATDYDLHALTFDYVPFPKTQLSAIWYHYESRGAIDTVADGWFDRVRLYFLVNF